jgi:hypothetical protein
MTNGISRAKELAEAAKHDYAARKKAAETQVVRWQWATFAIHSYEPAYFEISKVKPGNLLAAEPSEPADGRNYYGYDVQGRVVVEQQQTEFAGRVYETFFSHMPEGIERSYYTYDPGKDWIAVEWFEMGSAGVVECHAVFPHGGYRSMSYTYDERRHVIRRNRQAKGPPPYGDVIDDWHEITYDDAGQIARIEWCTPDGGRHLDFERVAAGSTLAAAGPSLIAQLTAAIVQAIAKLNIDEDVYTLVLSTCGAWYRHLIPPQVSVGLAAQCVKFRAEHGADASEYIWNPAEWADGTLQLDLAPDVVARCQSVCQDIWQNEHYAKTDVFLRDLAQSLQNASLPCPRSANFVAVVIALDVGDFASQIRAQVDEKTARRLHQFGLI